MMTRLISSTASPRSRLAALSATFLKSQVSAALGGSPGVPSRYWSGCFASLVQKV